MAHHEHTDHAPCCQKAADEKLTIAPHPEHAHSGVCDGNHHHVDMEKSSGTRLLITLGLNLIIPVIQVIAGLFAHSMALISDATHNFSDFSAILISYIAFRIGKKGVSHQNTFGYKRAEIIAALVNVIILSGACVFILYGAFQRLAAPETVSGHVVVWAALVGILGNGFSAWLLYRDSKDNLNIKGAFLHMLGDFLTSIAVMISGLIMMVKPWFWIDPVLSVLIAVFILKNCWGILNASTKILMNATPENFNIKEVHAHLMEMEGIKNVHYIHAWPVSSSGISFSCHLVVADQMLSQAETILQKARHSLRHSFGIDHCVLQLETEPCGKGTVLCEVIANGAATKYPQEE
ncbi:MAG: cation diffusion facilitator family transporter [Thermodesulfobacteriota bacterium]|nr:cation diffusion facilitator family transporter [Thermodesulfobacteriota bacterium]